MKEKFKEHINEKFKYIPDNPGIYFMKDEKENIIYIGKAKSIKKRVLSYLNKSI